MNAVLIPALGPEPFHGLDKPLSFAFKYFFSVTAKQFIVESFRTDQQAGIEQGDLKEKILSGKTDRILNPSYRMADLKTGIPERIKNGFRHLLHEFLRTPVMEKQQVYIGKGVQLTTAVPPEGDERQLPLGSGDCSRAVKLINDKCIHQ